MLCEARLLEVDTFFFFTATWKQLLCPTRHFWQRNSHCERVDLERHTALLPPRKPSLTANSKSRETLHIWKVKHFLERQTSPLHTQETHRVTYGGPRQALFRIYCCQGLESRRSISLRLCSRLQNVYLHHG